MANEIKISLNINFQSGKLSYAKNLQNTLNFDALGNGTAPNQEAAGVYSISGGTYLSIAPWANSPAFNTYAANCYVTKFAVLTNLSTNDGNTQFNGLPATTPISQCPFICVATNDASGTIAATHDQVKQYEWLRIPPGTSWAIPLCVFTTNIKARAFLWNGSAFVAANATLGVWALEQ